MHDEVRLHIRANVRHADQHIPLTRRNKSRKARGGGIVNSHSKQGFVAAAPAAKFLGIKQAQIESCVLLLAGVSESQRDPLRSSRHHEWHLNVGLILRAGDYAL